MGKPFGWELLTEQILECVAAEDAARRSEAGGDSEIERLLDHALRLAVMFTGTQHSNLCLLEDDDARRLMVDDSFALFYERQAQLDGWRVDFLFHCYDHGCAGKKKGWKRLIVECDGHAFHERTKEQAARDRSRDRWAVENGFTIYRYAGSEIWRNPLGCARQIFGWAGECWP